MTAKPTIAVTTSAGGGRYMWWFYWLALTYYGARPVRLIAPAPDVDLARFDGFVIGGGDDIGPALYGGEAMLDARLDPNRDRMEQEILAFALPRDLPVLGICRGAQMLNVVRGGSLHQNIFTAFAGVPAMRTPLPRKTVSFTPGSRLGQIHRQERLRVNSLHHQAIDRLGKGLEIVGTDEYSVPQAWEDRKATFLIGVQWHPEFLIYRTSHRRLFEAFLAACGARLPMGKPGPEDPETAQ